MSIPYVPSGTSKRFRVPRTLAADFDAFLDRDIPNTNMDFEILKCWYDKFEQEYEPQFVRGEIYPDSTKSRYENTDNNMNIRCSVTSGIRKGDMLIEPDGSVYLLDWAVHLQSNNAPSRALRCNFTFEVKRYKDPPANEDGYAVDDLGYVIQPSEAQNEDPDYTIVAPAIPANAYRYDGRPEYVAVSNVPGTIAGALTEVSVQYNDFTKEIKIGDKFDWGGNTHEIIDIDGVGVDLLQEYGVIRFQAKRAAGGLHGYE